MVVLVSAKRGRGVAKRRQGTTQISHQELTSVDLRRCVVVWNWYADFRVGFRDTGALYDAWRV